MEEKKVSENEHEHCHCQGEHEEEHEHCHCHDHHHDDHDHSDCGCGCGCGCGHDHDGGEGWSAKKIAGYVIGGIVGALGFMPFLPLPARLAASLAVYVFFGFSVFREMIEGFREGRIFTEFTLMCGATLGAFCIGEFADGAAVMLLYSLGESISGSAYSRSKRNISELLEVTPEYASALREGGVVRTSPRDVAVGETVIVVAGERIPLDGEVILGEGRADTSSVTGEAAPLELYPGVRILSGSILKEGSVRIRVECEYKDSAVAKLSEAVAEAEKRASPTEKKISRFAGVFTPIAFGVAAAVALIGSLVTGEAALWIRTGLSVLVISCPCSLVLSVPLTYFAGIGAGAKRGLIFKGGEVIDGMRRMSAIAFDKTGTLTSSEISFDGVSLLGDMPREDFLQLSYDVLVNSPHGAAVAFCDAVALGVSRKALRTEVIGGRGVVVSFEASEAVFGNAALMRERGADVADSETTAIFGMLDGVLLGRLDFSSRPKEGAREVAERLKASGCRVALISGDTEGAVRQGAAKLGIEEYYGGLTPSEKLERFESIYNEEKAKGSWRSVAFCGDGLNDSASVVRADVGIAMGKRGSALTVSSADLVIMDDSPAKIWEAKKLARRISGIADSNIAISLGIKLAVLCGGIAMAALGMGIPMELAVVADVGAAVITVLNALRANR